MSHRFALNCAIAAAVAAALLDPAAALAADVQLAADVGVGSSDNILRNPGPGRSETIGQVGVQFSVQNRSVRLSTDIRGDLAYFNYNTNSFPSEVVGNAGAAFRLGLIEDRLSWSLEDVFGQTRRDPFVVATPLNRENVNSFSTGPNLVVRFDAVSRIAVSARYGRMDYETDVYSTERYSAQAGYEHDLSSVSRLSLNLNQERVDPRIASAVIPDYSHQRAFGRYQLDSARTKASIDIGASRVDRSDLADNGMLVRLDVARKLGELSTINLRVGRQITDAGGSLGWSGGTALPTTGLITQSLPSTANPFTSTYADLGWLLAGRRTHTNFGASIYNESYAAIPQQDRRRYSATVRADRTLTPRLTARVGFSYNKYDYSNIVASNDYIVFDLGLNWKVGLHLSLDLSAQKSSYSSQLLLSNVDETRVWLKVRYETAK